MLSLPPTQRSLSCAFCSQVVVAFVRSSHDALAGGHGGWGAAAAGRPWQETTWRRSALAFLQVRQGRPRWQQPKQARQG